MKTDVLLPDPVQLRRFQAVADETRWSVVRLLSGGERCVCELQAELGASQSRLSFHLKKLREAGVIVHRRSGRWIYYRLVPEALEEMGSVLEEMRPVEEDTRTSGPPCCG